MYAIIETGGRQYWITPGETLQIEKLDVKEGEDVVFNALWSASPVAGKAEPAAGLSSAKVTAKVIRHMKAPKIIVFKRRPKKAYEKTQGHRQCLTEIQIKDIQLS